MRAQGVKVTLAMTMPSSDKIGSAQTSPVKVGPRFSVAPPAARELRTIVMGILGAVSFQYWRGAFFELLRRMLF